MKKETIVLDLTSFKKITGRLVRDKPYELKLIDFYSFLSNEDNDPFTLFTNHILKELYQDNELHTYDDITAFFKESYYVNVVMKFLDTLEIYILNKMPPNFLDIKFNRYVQHDNILKVEFNIILKE